MSKRSFLILSTGLFVLVLGIILAYPYRYAIAKRLYRQVNPPPAAREPHPSVGHVYGIDVSHHQDKIDWSQVRQWKGHPIEFVYIKASEERPCRTTATQRTSKAPVPMDSGWAATTSLPPLAQCKASSRTSLRRWTSASRI